MLSRGEECVVKEKGIFQMNPKFMAWVAKWIIVSLIKLENTE